MLASPMLHLPPAPTGGFVGSVWSRGLLEADVAIAKAAAAVDVLLLQQDNPYDTYTKFKSYYSFHRVYVIKYS
jgi:hypothetical protein